MVQVLFRMRQGIQLLLFSSQCFWFCSIHAAPPTELLPLSEDCSQTYNYFGDDVTCPAGHELYRYTSLFSEYNAVSSCSTCQCNGYTGTNPGASPINEYYNTGPECCDGWAGSLCDICKTVDVCPDLDYGNGTILKAVGCTSNQMAPANLAEATEGKKFSCFCGGGEDLESKQGVCNMQGQYRDPDDPTQKGATTTRFDWTFVGAGTDANPGTIRFEMNAGIHGNTWAPTSAPTQYDYFYPIVWEGNLDNCVITTGYCLDVAGTDVSSQQCYNYYCSDTQISCPPEGVEECPGGVNDCDDVPGTTEKYQMHKCNVVPASNVGFQISCLQEANDDGTFLCYYDQPGGYAPLSMTCNVGNCLYNNTNSSGAIDYGETVLDIPRGIGWQERTLFITTGAVLGFAIMLEFLRRSWDMRKERQFHDFKVLITQAESDHQQNDIAVRSSKSKSSISSISSKQELLNPLMPPIATSTDGCDPSPSLNDTGPKREGAVLSWHDMKLWVPAKASDQLAALHDNMTKNIEAFRNDLYGDLSGVDEGAGEDEYDNMEAIGATVGNQSGANIDHNSNGEYNLEKQILRGVSGSAPKSCVTALMGPSGAGKTSLLDCLAARKPMHRIEGDIRVNGYLCPPDRIRDVSGYVTQHDVLPGVLTVREHLLFHARLRCPPSMKDLQRRARVDELIKTLGLVKCANTMIGNEFKRGLSGGEKRRVSVAEELVVEPGILFLDEPTTGLDSTTAMSICQTLSDIARRGTTILLSIHQPREDIFQLFDRVLVMCEGGRVVFEGSTSTVPAYLRSTLDLGLVDLPKVSSYLRHLPNQHRESEETAVAMPIRRKNKKVRRYNPADLLLDVASCPKCQELADAYREGAFNSLPDIEQRSRSHSDWEGALGPMVVEDTDIIDNFEDKEHHFDEQMQNEYSRLENQPLEANPFKQALIYAGLMSSPVRDNLPPRHVAASWLQFAVLSERLVLTATRHPMLVALQYIGSLFLAICLGFIFQDLSDDLYGVQDRFGVLFFIPFCLVLLGMSSLPVWRDEHILFTHEQANKRIYNFPAYFFSVLFFDLVLVRTIPPIFFAVISYPMIGLNHGCDNCLIVFAFILVITNIISALIAMVVGAFRFSTSFSNLIGALLALLFALFAGFLVNRKSMSDFQIYRADPMAYSYEALLINQFANQKKMDGNEYYYTINGSWCAKGLTTVEASGNTLLSTFGFSNSQSDLTADITALWTGALYCAALAFGVLVVSAQAPYYSAAWQRVCQVNPFSIAGALLVAAFHGSASTKAVGVVDGDDETRERNSSVVSMNSESSSLPRGGNRRHNQNRPHAGSSESAGGSCASVDIPSDDEMDDFPDKPRDRVVSFEDEDNSGKIPQVFKAVTSHHRQLAHAQNLVDTLKWQLANPLGTEGDELLVGNIPPPMVLSFHDICLSVPYDYFAIAYAKKLLQQPPPVVVNNPNDYIIHSMSAYLDTNEILGMNVEGAKGSGHAIVKQIMPKSWAHRNGIIPGDAVIRIGDVKIDSYEQLGPMLAEAPRPVLIEFLRRSLRDTSAAGKGKHANLKPILKSVSGSTLGSIAVAPPPSNKGAGRDRLPAMVCGIMGPSGAGKTSLLDVLAGRKTVGVVSGSVRINGREMSPTELRLLSGYVVQEDILPPMLSVRECLDFQARLRVPNVGDGPTRRVDAVLKRMKLVRNSATLIGNEFRRGISGGEKRRVSVAIELLSEPAILFLDEPTTGQDSSTAVMLCKTLKKIARDGTTVVMSIHQPRIDIFEMMTQIVFMTREGRVAYCGPTAGLTDYINNNVRADGIANGLAVPVAGASSNPADELLDIMNVVMPQLLVDRYKESTTFATQQAVLDIVSDLEHGEDAPLMKRLIKQRGKHRSTWPQMLMHLSYRAARNTLRNPFPFFLHGVTAVFAAITLGIVFKNIHSKDEETEGTQDRFGIMFFLVLYLSLLALTSLPLWREEQQLFIAERASGIYGTSSYVLASMIFDVVPYRLLPPIAFAFISYPLIGLNDAPGHQTFFFLVLVACNLTLSGLCMLIGVLTTSNASANAAGSLAMLTSLLFCGYLLNKKQTPESFSWFTLWSPGNYAYEALVYNEMDGLDGLYITSTIADSKMTAGPFTGQELAHCFGFLDETFFDLFVLLIMGGIYFAGILIAMKVFIKEQR